MNTEIRNFLKHVDQTLELVKPVYSVGETCAVYFNLLGKFEISEEDSSELATEILNRDVGQPSISIYQDKIYTVIVSSPWAVDVDGEIFRPEVDRTEIDTETIITKL